jgi:hypothetical protein
VTDDRPPTEVPEPSHDRDLRAKRDQAVEIESCRAEPIGRGDLQAREAWSEHDEKALAIAWQQVASRASNDPRLLEDLARACHAGAPA